MTLLVRSLLLLLVCVTGSRPAHGTERFGDASLLHALQDHTEVASAVEREILALIASAPDEDRLELYWTYDQLVGAWLQVELVQTLLEHSVSTASPEEEEKTRSHLRDHARYALWDLDETRTQLERHIPDADVRERMDLAVNGTLRTLLSEARTTIHRLLGEQCLHVRCVLEP